jgi:hypothetical protein
MTQRKGEKGPLTKIIVSSIMLMVVVMAEAMTAVVLLQLQSQLALVYALHGGCPDNPGVACNAPPSPKPLPPANQTMPPPPPIPPSPTCSVPPLNGSLPCNNENKSI